MTQLICESISISVQCQPGYELVYPINMASPCRACELGWYNPGDANKCIQCKDGLITSTIGQPNCTLPGRHAMKI